MFGRATYDETQVKTDGLNISASRFVFSHVRLRNIQASNFATARPEETIDESDSFAVHHSMIKC